MASIAEVRQWEIWYVDWPHEDGTRKRRPALAISTSQQNAAQGFARFAKTTGQNHPGVPGRLAISPEDAHFKYPGLSELSWIHPTDVEKIYDAQLSEKRVGYISPLQSCS